MLQLEYEPEGVMEKAGDALGVVSHRVEGDLARFKDFLESRGRETGGWRGETGRTQVGLTLEPADLRLTNSVRTLPSWGNPRHHTSLELLVVSSGNH